VIIVIHEINMAARFCDEIVALKEGRLTAHGPPDTFMTAARLEAIYDVGMERCRIPTRAALCVRSFLIATRQTSDRPVALD
jgi:iron complex transport system ATP-binding protein